MSQATLRKRIDRLFWRAGFGPSPADRRTYVHAGYDAAVNHLLNPPTRNVLVGPRPVDDHNRPLKPTVEYGHDVLWWLDRMVRTRAPLVERMTLNLHDHFATSNDGVGDARLMLAQNRLLRRYALGNFGALAHGILHDHAMQWWLSLIGSNRQSPNENFARELMELFTLGSGYTEHDIREAARALTGFDYDWGKRRYFFNEDAHDTGVKKIFGHRGRYRPDDVVRLCLEHHAHPRFICSKIWSYFVPTPPSGRALAQMVRAYTRSNRELKPVLRVIFHSSAFYRSLEDPDMVKPPAVFLAGALRAAKMPIRTRDWSWHLDNMGQRLFYPPNVGGWDQNESFLTTMSFKARSDAIGEILWKQRFPDPQKPHREPVSKSYDWAHRWAGEPLVRRATEAELYRIGAAFRPQWDQDTHYTSARRRILRHLLMAGPDAQVH